VFQRTSFTPRRARRFRVEWHQVQPRFYRSIVATPGALAALEASGDDPTAYLVRHIAGDWGDVRRARPSRERTQSRSRVSAALGLHPQPRNQNLDHHRSGPQRDHGSAARGMLRRPLHVNLAPRFFPLTTPENPSFCRSDAERGTISAGENRYQCEREAGAGSELPGRRLRNPHLTGPIPRLPSLSCQLPTSYRNLHQMTDT
jgi:hypothetical protein